MITVYYDGKCGLCAKEISYYQRIAPEGVFDWQDVTEAAVSAEKDGFSLVEGLRILHARDSDGTLHKGVDAFILMWRQIRWWRILAGFVALPLVRELADYLYRLFAARRFNRLTHCQVALKNHAGQ